jgi:hypothetical protein
MPLHLTLWRPLAARWTPTGWMACALACALAGTPVVALAEDYTPIALPQASVNLKLTGGTGNAFYQPLFAAGDGDTSDGVPFVFTTLPSGANVISDPTAAVIPVGLSGLNAVYTLINTRWGSPRANVGAISFNWSNGRQDTVQLVVGQNVRDHFYGSYDNTLTSPDVTLAAFGRNVSGESHLDMQTFLLPDDTRELTLTSVTFSSTHMGVFGSPFLAGLTVGTPTPTPVPEPESLALLLAGVLVAGSWARHRRATGVTAAS